MRKKSWLFLVWTARTHRLAKSREARGIYHTPSPAGMAVRRWNARCNANVRLYADYIFLLVLFFFYDYAELNLNLTCLEGSVPFLFSTKHRGILTFAIEFKVV